MIKEEFEKIINNYNMIRELEDFEGFISQIESLKSFFITNLTLSESDEKDINQCILKKAIKDITNRSNYLYERIPLFFLKYIEEKGHFLNNETIDIIKSDANIHKKVQFLFFNVDQKILSDIYPIVTLNLNVSFEEKLISKYGRDFVKDLIKKNINCFKSAPVNKVKWIIENNILTYEEVQDLLKSIVILKSQHPVNSIMEKQKSFISYMNENTQDFYCKSLVFAQVKQVKTKTHLIKMCRGLDFSEILKHRDEDGSNFLHYLCQSEGVSYLIHLLKTRKNNAAFMQRLKEKNNKKMTPLDILISKWHLLNKAEGVDIFLSENDFLSSPKLDFLDMDSSEYSNIVKLTLDVLYEKDLLLNSFDFTCFKKMNYNNIMKIADLLAPYFLNISFMNKKSDMNKEEMCYALVLVCLIDEISTDNFKKINIIKYFLKNNSEREEILKLFPSIRKIIISNSDLSKSQAKRLKSPEVLKEFDDALKLIREYFTLNELVELENKSKKKRL